MKSENQDKKLLSDPLIKWIKTFKYDVEGADFNNLTELIGSQFLNNVMILIRYSRKKNNKDETNETVLTVADRLHNLRALMSDILDFYDNVLKHVVILKAPNLVRISESIVMEDCEDDLQRLLILILGCATQCSKKDKYIERISQLLNKEEQLEIHNYFDKLADCSMTADPLPLDLDDAFLQLHSHVTNLTHERLDYIDKYYDCFEKHSTSMLDDINYNEKFPILIRPVIPVDHGGQWEVAKQSNRYHPGISDRKEEDVLVIRYRPKIRFDDSSNTKKSSKQSGNGGEKGLSDEDREKLRKAEENLKNNEMLMKQLNDMKQQLHEMDYQKKRVKDLQADNSKLIIDKQRLQDQLNSSRKKEEDVIERLVDCQMKMDEVVAEREIDRKKIDELMRQGGNRRNADNNELSDYEQDSLVDNKSTKKKFKEYEREIESLKTRLMEAQKQDNQSDEKWKFLEVQKEKVDARRQLNDALKQNEELKKNVEKMELKIETLDKELQETNETADISRSASDDQVSQLEERIKDLTRQITLLRKKGAKLSGNTELEDRELDLMYETVQELTTEVTRLKAHNKVLRQTCDKLKRDVTRVAAMETETNRLLDENQWLRQNNATQMASTEGDDELRRQNIQLQVENRKLRRMIDTLRYMLMQVDPHNKHKYTYITSF